MADPTRAMEGWEHTHEIQFGGKPFPVMGARIGALVVFFRADGFVEWLGVGRRLLFRGVPKPALLRALQNQEIPTLLEWQLPEAPERDGLGPLRGGSE